jgi:hypothetical protein
MNVLKERINLLESLDCPTDVIYDFLIYEIGSYYTKPVFGGLYLQKIIKKLNKKIGNPIIFKSWETIAELEQLIYDYEIAYSLNGLGGTNKILKRTDIINFIGSNFK